ncbi:histone deacetylase [Chitinivorax sp. B]|uniref:histone deacetylase family protein n=1 Tax=Chitinivorax sp. B TaxID=2502235 RepID=UPI0010F4AFF3|nr:histone deacetylase [Chitinivorax sp. B]
MELYYTDHFVLPLPTGHRFPMSKYVLLRDQISTFASTRLHEAPAASDNELTLAHSSDYVRRVVDGALTAKEQREIGFPWSPEMVERSRRSAGATIAACRSALSHGCGANLAGGTHHAHVDKGSGFCVFNDSVIAPRVLQREGLIRRALVVDLDVHQGNGTAAILRHDPSIYTFSVHGKKNFPFRKEPSDRDIELDDDTGDEFYLSVLATALPQVMAAARPDLVIYLAGADPLAADRLGRLSLSLAGLRARDELVFQQCDAAGVPIAISMGGGYAEPIELTVAAHTQTLRHAVQRYCS